MADNNRRCRLHRDLDPKIRDWLVRLTRAHAHLCYMVRLFGNPSIAGGQSLLGDTFAERAAAGDRTLLYDACSYVMDEIGGIRHEIDVAMDAAPPTHHLPGTAEKVAVMFQRAERGEALFIEGDAMPAPLPLD